MTMGYSVYKINFPHDKTYIGQTKKSVKECFISHVWDRTGTKSELHRPKVFAMKKYKGQTSYEILEENLNQDEADFLEKYYIKYFNSTDINFGYNLSPGGASGSIMSEGGKKRHREKMQKHYSDPEYIEKMAEARQKYMSDLGAESFSKLMQKTSLVGRANPESVKTHLEKTTEFNKSRLQRAKSKGFVPFMCEQTGEIFQMLSDAAEKFGVDKRRISAHLNEPKRYKTIQKKYTFKRVKGE